jgi:hypothetical protein
MMMGTKLIDRVLGVLLPACLLVTSVAAHAALQDEIQVYDDAINAKGEYSLELHLNTTPNGIKTGNYNGEVLTNGNTRITPEFAYGLGNGFELGLYLNTVVNNGRWDYAGYKARLKWLPILEKDGYPFFAGVNVEVGNVLYQYDQSRYGAEARFILGKHVDKWLFVVNPIFGHALSQPYRTEGPNFAMAARVSRDVTPELALGVEYYSDIGLINQTIAYQQTGQAAFLMMYWDGKPFSFQFGVGKGLTQNTDSLTVKGIISIPLPE